jgi:hypothetical protein
MATREEQIAAANERADAAYAAARNNTTLSPEGRTRAIAQAWGELKSTLDAIRASIENATNNRRDQLAKQIYGLPSAADSLSYRDALDRVNQIPAGDTRQALTLLEQARVSGDDLLTRAVLSRSYADGWANVIDTYTTANPQTESAAEELWALTIAATAENIVTTRSFIAEGEYKPQKPPEIARYDDWAIANLAAGDPQQSSQFA